jgi:Protein of unknown function, DUF481
MQKIFITLFLFLISFSVSAQVVNIEKQRKEYKRGFQGKVAFSFNIIQNTSKIIQGSNAVHLQYIKNKHTFLLLNDYTLMKVQKDSDDIDLVNKNFQHFRYGFSIVDTNAINFELFVQRQQNKIKYLDFRFLTGAGLRFRIIENDFMTLYFAPLAMYEHEILSDSAATTTKMIKGDFYISLRMNLTKNVYFSNVTYYQPALFDVGAMSNFEPFSDFRLSSESSFSFVVFKNIEYSTVFELAYDSRPPEELINQPLFYNLKNKLVFKF